MDYLFTDEGGRSATYGKEGETYDMKDNAPMFKTELLKDDSGALNCNNRARYTFAGDGSYGYGFPHKSEEPKYADGKWTPADVSLVFGSDELFSKTYEARNELYINGKYPDEPNVRLTLEESNELAQIMTDIKKYSEEVIARIITGVEPLDSLDAAVAQVKSMGIDRAIEIKQAAYDRYLAK